MIEKITDKKELSRLIMASMKRGVATNCFTASSFTFDIDEGRLYYEKRSDSLFLLRKRDDVCILNFYVNGNIALPSFTDVCGELSVVTEIPVYDSGNVNEAEARLRDIVTDGGFECILERTMLERAVCGAETPICNDARITTSCPDVRKMYDVLKNSLSPATGCVPTFSEFSSDTENGCVFALYEEGDVKGVLRCGIGKKELAIKQLAVDGKYRRQGIGEKLVSTALHAHSGKKATVWTDSGNTAALSLYKKCGFVRLSRRSYVYIKTTKTTETEGKTIWI